MVKQLIHSRQVMKATVVRAHGVVSKVCSLIILYCLHKIKRYFDIHFLS